MAIDIRIAQFFNLTTTDGTTHRYQNYFVNESYNYLNQRYEFAPFRAEGTISNNTGDNAVVQVLFPNVDFAIRLLDAGNGNRHCYADRRAGAERRAAGFARLVRCQLHAAYGV